MKFRMGCNVRSAQYMDRVVANERRRPGHCADPESPVPPHYSAYVTADGAASVVNASSFDELVKNLLKENRKSGGILVVHHIERTDRVYIPNAQEEVRCRAAELLQQARRRREDAAGNHGSEV